MNNNKLVELVREIVSEVVSEAATNGSARPTANERVAVTTCPAIANSADEVRDLSAVNFREILSTPNPANPEEFLKIKRTTSARLGVWRAGPRYRTETLLRFRADHAAAMDAVFSDLSQDLLNELGLETYSTICTSKDEFLTRPDMGRLLSPETVAEMQSKCKRNPQVQIFFADGLSNTAVESNIKDLLPSVMQGLKSNGVDVGTPFFLKYGRVGAMDAVTEALGSEVTVIFLGERPGLASSESLSAYMTYKGYIGAPETIRSVVSNIYHGGTNPVEAGAHIADIVRLMLKQKASGLDLKL